MKLRRLNILKVIKRIMLPPIIARSNLTMCKDTFSKDNESNKNDSHLENINPVHNVLLIYFLLVFLQDFNCCMLKAINLGVAKDYASIFLWHSERFFLQSAAKLQNNFYDIWNKDENRKLLYVPENCNGCDQCSKRICHDIPRKNLRRVGVENEKCCKSGSHAQAYDGEPGASGKPDCNSKGSKQKYALSCL